MRTKDGKWKISIDLYFISMNILVFIGVSIVSAIISALIYWGFHRLVEIPEAIYTIVISIAMLCEFEENDWKMLLEVVSERTVEWQKRLAYCMHDKSDLNQLRVLLNLVETDDSELFEIVVDSLRDFTSEESLNLIQTDLRIISKIEELMPKRVFEEFLKNK